MAARPSSPPARERATRRVPERDGHGHRARAPGARRGRGGGTDGNERLTTQTGALLIVLLAVLGVTILRIGQLLWIHLFVGLLLIGPLALKLASTGYRFARYYTREPRYRRKGPPPPALRLLAPLVVLATFVVFASGVALLLLGPSSRDSLLLVHKASFVVWLGLTALHVLGHLPELQRVLLPRAELRGAVFAQVRGAHQGPAAPPAGGAGRALSLGGALLGGLVLALVLLPQYGPWLHYYHRFH
jgi:hypothetical protein